MAIELIEERRQTGESWAKYKVTIPICGNIWTSGIRIHCYTDGERILLDMPHSEGII